MGLGIGNQTLCFHNRFIGKLCVCRAAPKTMKRSVKLI
jgi:hypothetical protein